MGILYIPLYVPEEFEQMLEEECLINETTHGQKLYPLPVPGTQDLIMNTIELTIKKLHQITP